MLKKQGSSQQRIPYWYETDAVVDQVSLDEAVAAELPEDEEENNAEVARVAKEKADADRVAKAKAEEEARLAREAAETARVAKAAEEEARLAKVAKRWRRRRESVSRIKI